MSNISETRGARNQIAAGQRLICFAVGAYALAHTFFFGVPHFPRFALSTLVGKAEIVWAFTTLLLVGIGAHSIYSGTRESGK